MAAAYEGKTVKQWLLDLARVRLAEMEISLKVCLASYLEVFEKGREPISFDLGLIVI